ncbi:LPS-assembly protein LptD [Hippea jasoniae]|uniref:LPS-assembly protein LptD n=1 Tax=Hippea jasoniae TaxID=944479 RepID=UPI000551554A|nr:putative LPS assembly protein LptD [Hippea jasoniae]
MRKIVLTILFFLFAIVSHADNAIHIKADHISFNKQTNTYTAYGNCTIINDNITVNADFVSYNTTTYRLEAKNNILITFKNGDWIKGKYAIINYSTYKGFVDNAVIYTKSNNLYTRAKKVILYDKNHYYLKNGVITSCRCKDFIDFKEGAYPKWSIWAKNTYIKKDDYIFAYPVVLQARSVPVFASPFIRRSLNKKRKTGFLMPQLGFSSKDGYQYIQPFFINISPSEDITLYPFSFSRLGDGIKGQYRFYWTKHSKGEWNITILKEKKPFGTNENKKTRINLKAQQWADFGKYGYFKYDINIVNNKDNLKVINQNKLTLSSDRYTTSKASYYIAKNSYYLSLYAYYYQDLIAKNNKETLQKLPVLEFGAINKKLYKNLTLDFSQTLSNNFRITGNRGYYSLTEAFLSYPFKVSFLNITPKAGFHEIYANWKNSDTNQKFSRKSFVPDYSITASSSIYGIFLTNNKKGFLGLKHTITPTISYHYIPKRRQDFADFVPTFSKTNEINFTLENSLNAKFFEDNQTRYRKVFYNKISIVYDYTNSYKTRIKPIYEETTIKPFDFLSFTSQAHYFIHKHTFIDSTETVSLSFDRAGLSAGYTMSKPYPDLNMTDESINGKVYFYPTKKLYTYASFEKSIIHSYYPSKKFGFLYTDDCYSIGLDFYFVRTPTLENNTYKTTLNKGFWITLTLNGLFSIKKQY